MAKASLSQYAEQNEEVAALLAGSLGNVAVARRLKEAGVETSEVSVRRYRSSINWQPQQIADVDHLKMAAEEDLIAENDRLRAANQRLFKSNTKLKSDRAEYMTAIYNAVEDAANRDPLEVVPQRTKDNRRSKKAEAALWHLTDWQGGKKTSSYNMDVMDQRVEVFTTRAAELTEIMRADHPVEHCEILLGGDMVEGVQIFPGQVWELDGTLFDQIFRVADRLVWAVQQALLTYRTVGVTGEWGNHGRIGKKGDGLKASDNVDRIVYEIAARKLRDQKGLTHFNIWDKWYQHFTVGNYKGLLVHGDEIKSFGGNTPSYGILRKANAWSSGVVPAFRDMYIGHYHQSMELQMANGGSVYMSGSIESDNEYAREFVAAVSKPSQRINFVDPQRGRVTYESKIWVTED